MSESAHYLKVLFPSEAAAKKAEPKLDRFFQQSVDAFNFWQKSYYGNPLVAAATSSDTFWTRFKRKFPLVWKYVESLNIKDPNDLSGLFDFGQDENNEVLRQGDTLCWADCNVGSQTTWVHLCEFLVKKYGGIKAVCNDDGTSTSLNDLYLFDYEQIVKDILGHKELYPLLIGINKELDSILDQKGKRN